MKKLMTIITITICIVFITKTHFGQAIKVNSSGNVGVNGTPGSEALKVYGPINLNSNAITIDNNGKVGINGNPGSEALKIGGDMKITQDAAFDGYVGINDTPGSERLRIKGAVHVEGTSWPNLSFQIDDGGRMGIAGPPHSSNNYA